MLKIRLQRVGRAHEPSFRLVLTEGKNGTKSGRFKEMLGSYDPRKTIEAFKSDRIKYWLGIGALATPTVHNLLIKKGLIRGKKIAVAPVVAAAAPVSPEAPVEAEAAPVAEAPEVTEVPEVAETPEVSEIPETPVQ